MRAITSATSWGSFVPGGRCCWAAGHRVPSSPTAWGALPCWPRWRMPSFCFWPAVAGRTVMLVAAVGIALNGISAWMLHAGSHGDLNRRSAYLHMLSDAVVSAGVVLSGLLIVWSGWSLIDPIVSLVIVAVILVSTWRLLRDSLTLSLDGVPASVNSSAVMSYLADQRGVTDVHDLHIWALSTTSVALTAHLVVPDRGVEDALLTSLTPDLKRRFQIQHATLQIERDRCVHGCEDEAAA